MKVLISINSFGRGGAEKSTASFVIKIKEQYPDFEFICIYFYKHTPGFYDEIAENGVELIQIKEKGLIGRIRKFKEIINTHEPDVIHSILYEANLVARLSSIGSNYIFVESLVNKPYHKQREFQNKGVKYKRYVVKFIDIITSKTVDHFHAVGHAVANHYLNVYKWQFNYTVVHRGRPIPELKENLTLKKNEKLILITTARQEYQKGLIYLLRAAKILKGKVKIQILGREGAATPVLKEYIKKNALENDVEFCGYLKNINPVVQKADLYVSNSLYEGLPGSVIEAMALKKPLLLSDIEEHREVAAEDQNAFFFTPTDIEGLVKGTEQFMNNPELLTDFGNKSFEIFQEKFTEKAMVEGMVNFYLNLKV